MRLQGLLLAQLGLLLLWLMFASACTALVDAVAAPVTVAGMQHAPRCAAEPFPCGSYVCYTCWCRRVLLVIKSFLSQHDVSSLTRFMTFSIHAMSRASSIAQMTARRALSPCFIVRKSGPSALSTHHCLPPYHTRLRHIILLVFMTQCHIFTSFTHSFLRNFLLFLFQLHSCVSHPCLFCAVPHFIVHFPCTSALFRSASAPLLTA